MNVPIQAIIKIKAEDCFSLLVTISVPHVNKCSSPSPNTSQIDDGKLRQIFLYTDCLNRYMTTKIP